MKRALRGILRHPTLVLGGVACLPLLALAFFGPQIAPYSFSDLNPSHKFAPPFEQGHWLGTDQFGRDVASRLIFGARYSLLIALAAATLATLIGGLFGLLAGYFDGLTSSVIMRATDLLLAFPSLLLAIVLVAIVGPGLVNAAVILGIVYSPRLVRIMRGEVLRLKDVEFVQAAVALGGRHGRIMFRHVLVNTVPTLVVYMSILFAYALLAETALSFLGLGVQPPFPSWGGMLRSARDFLFYAPSLSYFPGIAVVYAVFSVNLLSDGLSEALDPRAARS